MEKLKRILAILAIISLVFCALLTLVLALLTNFELEILLMLGEQVHGQ